MKAALLIVLLLSFSHLQMTWASFLDPFGLFDKEAIEEIAPEKEVEIRDTRTAEFNSSFLIVGKLLKEKNEN